MVSNSVLAVGVLFIGLFVGIFQQGINPPYFLRLDTDGIDGNLKERLASGIDEDLPIGTSLGFLQCRDVDGDEIFYSGNSDTLAVNKTTGEVTLVRKLDRETYLKETGDTVLAPTFYCFDATLSSSSVVDITINDINDNGPIFTKTNRADIPENTPNGTNFLNVSVTDLDDSSNAQIVTICDRSDAEFAEACDVFYVSKNLKLGEGNYSVQLSLKGTLDYEQIRSYSMRLLAKDQAVDESKRLNITNDVLINIIDTQDTPPLFYNTPILITVTENAAIGTQVERLISVGDGDTGSPRPVRVNITHDPLGLFEIASMVRVTDAVYGVQVQVRGNIDKESTNGQYVFTMQATEMDGNTPTNDTVTTNVTVSILDENDNVPQFSQQVYNLVMAEISSTQNNFQLPNLQIQVTDPDDLSNAQYRVFIWTQTHPVFRVSPAHNVSGSSFISLLVMNASLLDYDVPAYRNHTVVLQAVEVNVGNQLPRSSQATVNIFLQDLNHNSPKFELDVYTFTLPENAAVNTPITTIRATDIDEGANGHVTYSLSGTGSNQFQINEETGLLILANPLDFERQATYQIFIEATDDGTPPRRVQKTLTLFVTNVNDEAPVPERLTYQTFAQETSLLLRPGVTVRAIDTEDPNNNPTYRIVAGNSPNQAFQVNPITGEFTMVRNVSYDNTPGRLGVFEVVIEASDNGNPPQTVNMTVVVQIQDENNNDPLFTRPIYTAEISELTGAGVSVVHVTATDADSGQNGDIRYTIWSGGREHFDIGTNNGLITVSNKANFDYNMFPVYRMTVHAIDKGSPPRTGTTIVQVTMLDANNKNPQFPSQIYLVNVAESAPIGTSVLDVTATDVDSTSLLRYSIPTSSITARGTGGTSIVRDNLFPFRQAFTVNEVTGLITTNTTLNRALVAEIQLNVLVEDMNAQDGTRQTATTSVFVTILGTNVSTIFFTRPSYDFTLTEGKLPGFKIITVAALDPACGNCLVRNYVEQGNTDQGYLEVDRFSGDVTLTKELDYEFPAPRLISMVIEARTADNRVAQTTVTVTVRDDNDNSPIFMDARYNFTVSETAPYLTRVGYVRATDLDSGSFGRIQYSLSGQGRDDFQIFDSGMIVVGLDANLDYENKTVYNLLVTAVDNPTNLTSTVKRQTSVSLTINVRDENDNSPVFGATYPFYVVENFEIGRSVGRVVATDKDAGTNRIIDYTMDDPSGLFRMIETGYILTQRSLRGMSVNSPYNMTVYATDRGRPSRRTAQNVIINVRSGQLDDGKPQWSAPRLGEVYFVNESVPASQFVVQAQARARGDTPDVIYALSRDGMDYMMFKIDPVTGVITTNGTFDREVKEVYDIILIATDANNRTLSSFRNLIVRVRDSDDSRPDFRHCPGVSLEVPQNITVDENTPNNTIVYTVTACDRDKIVNGVTYRPERIIPICARAMVDSPFDVLNNGSIKSNRVLDREVRSRYLVCVRALPARRKRQAEEFDVAEMVETNYVAYVVINLRDLNDNGPVFINKTLVRVVPSIPSTTTTVVRVLAIDPDQPPRNRVRYRIATINLHQPGYPVYELRGAFVINSDTGIVSTNYPSYQDFRGTDTYFELTIIAEDYDNSAMSDTMTLRVWIFQPAQTIRLVLNEKPDVARGKVDEILAKLRRADPDSIYQLQQVSYHRVVNTFDVSRTDMCFVMVSNTKVLSVREGSSIISQQRDVQDVLDEYGAGSPGSCYRTRSSLDKIDWAPLWWCLVALAIFIFVCCVILIIVIFVLYNNYKNYMKTRKTYLVPQ